MTTLLNKTLANRYRVDSFLGRGGMAEVYKVWDSRRMTFLAMKVLFEDLAIDRVFMRRFKREAETLAKLQHPNIVRFYGLEQDGPNAFMLMDFVEGKTLKRAIFDAGGAMPQEEIRKIMRAVCGALQFAHTEGLVHCDIKPANIMLHENGTVLLSDFGIARMTDAATATMVGAGTPAYMAPEQVRGQDPTPQTDIYGLGIVLYEMLTGGERPFTGETATITGSTSEKLRWEQINAQPTPPRQWNKNITPALEAVILKSLQKDGRKRYKTALDFFNALELAFGAKMAEPLHTQPEPAPVVDTPAAPPANAPEPRETNRPPDQQTIRPPDPKKWLPFGIAAIFLLGMGWLMGGGLSKVFGTNTPVLGIGSTMTSEKDGMVMVYVPEGEFLMGSDSDDALAECEKYGDNCKRDWFTDEEPIHSLYLDSFWIDQTEVTNAMFANFLNAEGNQSKGGATWLDVGDDDVLIVKNGSNWQPKSGYDNHPVVAVSWYGAQAYCEWAGRNLPAEAQWEKAAGWDEDRQSQNVYPWGNTWNCAKTNADDETIEDDYVNEGGANCDGYKRTAPVGSFPAGASFYGAYDMAGNVWEWVNDWYDGDYYANSSSSNPLGSETGSTKVLRGGSWDNSGYYLRAADREGDYPDNWYNNVGFRCSLSLP